MVIASQLDVSQHCVNRIPCLSLGLLAKVLDLPCNTQETLELLLFALFFIQQHEPYTNHFGCFTACWNINQSYNVRVSFHEWLLRRLKGIFLTLRWIIMGAAEPFPYLLCITNPIMALSSKNFYWYFWACWDILIGGHLWLWTLTAPWYSRRYDNAGWSHNFRIRARLKYVYQRLILGTCHCSLLKWKLGGSHRKSNVASNYCIWHLKGF